MTLPTITVDGFFGPREITRDKFIEVWTQHVGELHRLSHEPEWTNEVHEIREKIEAKAGEEFDRMFLKEHGTDWRDYRGADYGED